MGSTCTILVDTNELQGSDSDTDGICYILIVELYTGSPGTCEQINFKGYILPEEKIVEQTAATTL